MDGNHRAAMVAAFRRLRTDLVLVAEDGRRVGGVRALACLASPLLASVLATHDQREERVVVSLPVKYEAVLAFKR